MKGIIISSSERRFGITSNISEKAKLIFEKMQVEIEIVYLCEMNFSPCDGCGSNNESCNTRKTPCEKHDDMQSIIEMMISSDIIIYACPVHAFGINHLMQIFLERSGVGYLRYKRPLVNKIASCIIVGRKYHLGHAHDQIVNNILLNRMIIPGSGFPVLIHGDEETHSTADLEEIVALEQMIERLVEICKSVNYKLLKHNYHNEREQLALRESQL